MLTSHKEINQSLINDGIEPNEVKEIPQSYSEGRFDGKIGIEASKPENWDYWLGYCQGYREFLCRKKGIELEEEF